jgi:hypothetical protein
MASASIGALAWLPEQGKEEAMKGWIVIGVALIAGLVIVATAVARSSWGEGDAPAATSAAALQLEEGFTPETMPLTTCGVDCTH